MSVAAPLLTDEQTYTAGEVCQLTGATYRQVDYWARTGLVVPSVREANGPGGGKNRLYSAEDARLSRAISNLLEFGFSLQAIRRAIASRGMPWFINEMVPRLQNVQRDLGDG